VASRGATGSDLGDDRPATVTNREQLLTTRPWHANQQLRMTLQPTPGVQFEILLTRNDNDGAA
jgi:hypothetical protein